MCPSANAKIRSIMLDILKPHQKEALDWMVNIEENVPPYGGILADDMGLGKTVEAIALMTHNGEISRKKPTLVVVPASLKIQWVKEISKFAPELTILFDCPGGDVVVTSYHKLYRNERMLTHQWHRVIMDEAHFIRNSKGMIHQSLYENLKAKHTWFLTGTPIQCHKDDITNLFNFLNIENEFGDSEWLKKVIEKYVLRRTKKSLEIPMPPITFKHFDLEFKKDVDDECYRHIPRTEVWKLVEMLRQRQFALVPEEVIVKWDEIPDFECWDDPNPPTFEKSEKLDAVIKTTRENYQSERIVIFTQFLCEISYIKYHLARSGIKSGVISGSVPKEERDRIIKNHDQIDVLILQLMAGSVGLNLQMFNSVMFTAPHWNPQHQEQAICRVYRLGQKNAVNVRSFNNIKTIESYISVKMSARLELARSMGF